jgi:hypothetical protein
MLITAALQLVVVTAVSPQDKPTERLPCSRTNDAAGPVTSRTLERMNELVFIVRTLDRYPSSKSGDAAERSLAALAATAAPGRQGRTAGPGDPGRAGLPARLAVHGTGGHRRSKMAGCRKMCMDELSWVSESPNRGVA